MYVGTISALEITISDGIKLLKSGFDGTKSIIIYGYDYENFPLLKTIELYEKIAKNDRKSTRRV